MPLPLLPLPLPLPLPMPASSTLGARINVATRKQHTELNRLLIQRLPCALPPNRNSPLLYGQGIVPFASIFFFFETEWDVLTRQALQEGSAAGSREARLRSWLATLRPHGLARSTRLQADLKHLRDVAGSEVDITVELGDGWMQDLRMRIQSQPHVLVAFAWVFYMAVFSGGRWIRQQLSNSGSEFWTQQSGDERLGNGGKVADVDTPGYCFLSFDGEQDGEDIKASFKARLAEAEVLLTAEEQADVIDVAQQLFARCNKLVGELDRKMMWDRMSSELPRVVYLLLIVVACAAWRAWSHYLGHAM